MLWDLLESMKVQPLSYREFAWRSQIIEHEAEAFFKDLLSNDMLEDVTSVTTFQRQDTVASLTTTNNTTEGVSDFSPEQVAKDPDRDREVEELIMSSPTEVTSDIIDESDEFVEFVVEAAGAEEAEKPSAPPDSVDDIVVWDQGEEDEAAESVSFTIG